MIVYSTYELPYTTELEAAESKKQEAAANAAAAAAAAASILDPNSINAKKLAALAKRNKSIKSEFLAHLFCYLGM